MTKKSITIGLIGNPNCGKTTLFNALTGARQKVANWAGVTVERREGFFHHKGYSIKVVDLPGAYSLTSFSMEELITRNFIFNDKPDFIVNVVDAGNLERNLYLTTQLIDIEAPVIIALNMIDEAYDKGLTINTEKLSQLFSMPVVPTVGTKNIGIEQLKDSIVESFEKQLIRRKIVIPYGNDIEQAIQTLQTLIDKNVTEYPSRWLAISLIEGDIDAENKCKHLPDSQEIIKTASYIRSKLSAIFNDDLETVFSDMRYGFISGALKEAVHRKPVKRYDITQKIDSFVLNRYIGFPLLFIILFILFHLTFILGEYPKKLIELAVQWISNLCAHLLPPGQLQNLVVQGIIGGVGSVIVFLPNILILFLGISFMEDSGYMARSAFLMDKIMHSLGLHGKSFIPLVMGFGCNVPAIMATRSLENKRDRILTVLINPFMSCSARLPVYILFAGTFFPQHAGFIILFIYALGILLAFVSAKIFNNTILKGKSTPFVMELPPYRMPTAKTILIHMWDRASSYLRKMGGIILAFSIIIWVLSEYPKPHHIEQDYNSRIKKVHHEYKISLSQIQKANYDAQQVQQIHKKYLELIDDLEIQKRQEMVKYTFIGQIGLALYPLLQPLGFNWQMGVSLTTGFVAKEVVVSTMGVLYHANDDNQSLSKKLINPRYGITPASALAFMIFVMIYIPCLATVIAIAREIGPRWAVFSIFYQVFVAWLVSFAVYHLARLII
ncbi:MAG: ferrous iron transport protein B [Spirochaetes bacterium]|nr:ferrous iron transport protein B [Spirochaetota bacterium]